MHTETVTIEDKDYVLHFRCENYVDGGTLIVGTVDQFPDVKEYNDSYDFTKQLLIDTIETYLKIERGCINGNN